MTNIEPNQYGDSPEQIQRCLNCTLPRCVDCASHGGSSLDRLNSATPRPPKNEKERAVYDSYILGLYDVEISRKLGINVNTVRKHRINMGFPCLPKGIPISKRKILVSKWMW